MTKKKKVVVGMSGGVDSSVVALLLKEQGFDVVGLHMKSEGGREADEDELAVRALCENLGIECYVENYDDQMQAVKDYFLSEYAAGRTPNPCVVCNKMVKFKPFIQFAEKLGADFFATGHYANVEHSKRGHLLKKAADPSKDQSYFLNALSQDQLSKVLFPLGSLTKDEVRKIAADNGLVSAHKKDSQDVCFVGSQKFRDYIDKACPQTAGDIVNIANGKVVGKHQGIMKYTIGQRKGLGIGGGHGETGDGWFVVKKDIKSNVVFVAEGDGQELLSSAVVSNNFNWILGAPPQREFDCMAKIRYRQADQPAGVVVDDDGSVRLEFKQKQRAACTGQYAVLYKNDDQGGPDICLGGGVIDDVL